MLCSNWSSYSSVVYRIYGIVREIDLEDVTHDRHTLSSGLQKSPQFFTRFFQRHFVFLQSRHDLVRTTNSSHTVLLLRPPLSYGSTTAAPLPP